MGLICGAGDQQLLETLDSACVETYAIEAPQSLRRCRAGDAAPRLAAGEACCLRGRLFPRSRCTAACAWKPTIRPPRRRARLRHLPACRDVACSYAAIAPSRFDAPGRALPFAMMRELPEAAAFSARLELAPAVTPVRPIIASSVASRRMPLHRCCTRMPRPELEGIERLMDRGPSSASAVPYLISSTSLRSEVSAQLPCQQTLVQGYSMWSLSALIYRSAWPQELVHAAPWRELVPKGCLLSAGLEGGSLG